MGIDFAEFNVDDLNTVIKVVGVGGVGCLVLRFFGHLAFPGGVSRLLLRF